MVPHDAASSSYNVEFSFDLDVPATLRIVLFAQEAYDADGNVRYITSKPECASAAFPYLPGPEQRFSQPSFVLHLDETMAGRLQFRDIYAAEQADGGASGHRGSGGSVGGAGGHRWWHGRSRSSGTKRDSSSAVQEYPLVILAECGTESLLTMPIDVPVAVQPGTADAVANAFSSAVPTDMDEPGQAGNAADELVTRRSASRSALHPARSRRQAMASLCSIELEGQMHRIKCLKQKVFVAGVMYIIQEIFGLQNSPDGDGDGNGNAGMYDSSNECIVCMAEPRDTVVLPCRHLSLCGPCAEVLRYQSNKCPICRAPFHALLQIRVARRMGAVAPSSAAAGPTAAPAADPGNVDADTAVPRGAAGDRRSRADGDALSEAGRTSASQGAEPVERYCSVPITEALMDTPARLCSLDANAHLLVPSSARAAGSAVAAAFQPSPSRLADTLAANDGFVIPENQQPNAMEMVSIARQPSEEEHAAMPNTTV